MLQNRPDGNEQILLLINYRRAFSLDRATQSSTQTLSWTRVHSVEVQIEERESNDES